MEAAHRRGSAEKLAARNAYVLREIDRLRPPDTAVIFTGEYIGDSLYMLAYAEEYAKANPDKKLLIATRPFVARNILPGYRGYSVVEVLSRRRYRLLAGLGCNPRYREMARRRAVFFLPFMDEPATGYPTLLGKLCHETFCLRDAQIHYHANTPPPQQLLATENFDRTVVLNPYSNSTHYPAEKRRVLENLAAKLRELGYTVYTNTVKDQLPVRGTRELRCSLAQMYDLAGRIPLVISVRSGLLDYLVPSGANIYAIYFKNGITPALFNLAAWGCSGKIREVTDEEFFADGEFTGVAEFLREIAADRAEQ